METATSNNNCTPPDAKHELAVGFGDFMKIVKWIEDEQYVSFQGKWLKKYSDGTLVTDEALFNRFCKTYR